MFKVHPKVGVSFLIISFCLFTTSSFSQVSWEAKNEFSMLSTTAPSGIGNVSEINFKSSNLPILVITTNNGEIIRDDPKINAKMGIIYNGPGVRNNVTDKYNHYEGKIGIELRGNSTQGFPKKPYNFETRDSSGANLDVSLLGMPKESDWVLSASYLDHTFIRNPLASHLSELAGHWASRCRMVEVVLNKKYQGIYILMESIKRGKDRLDIAKLEPDEINNPSITGGFIWEISGFNDNLGQSRYLKYPKYDKAAPEQINYITQNDNSFRSVMKSNNYKDEETGYKAWINVPSFIDELIVQEAIRNSDAYGWSGYFNKDKDGKINAGPVWDFDQSAGNSSYPDNGVVEGWMFENPLSNNTPFFWKLLFYDPDFGFKVRKRWEELRKGAYNNDNLVAYIDSIAGLLSEAQTREFKQWQVLGGDFWRETIGFDQRLTYQSEVNYLTDFLVQRWEWMDEELARIKEPYPSNIDKVINNNIIQVYPNPVITSSTIGFRVTEQGFVLLKVLDINSREIATLVNETMSIGNYSIDWDASGLEGGIYFCKMQNGSFSEVKKILLMKR